MLAFGKDTPELAEMYGDYFEAEEEEEGGEKVDAGRPGPKPYPRPSP